MGAKVRKAVLTLLFISLIWSPSAGAATSKPTPKSTAKAASKPVAKASPASTVKISTKVVPKKSTSTSKKSAAPTKNASAAKQSTKKAIAKPASKTSNKKVVQKKVVRKKVRVSPSPKPQWPPAGFYTDKSSDNDVYARIPSSKELIGVISAKASLSQRIAECEKFACGAVQVASFIGCSWWEVTSTLYDTDPDKSRKIMGTLRTLVGKSAPQQILTILLISQENVVEGQIIDNISVSCHRDTPTENFPQYTYTPAPATTSNS